MKTCDVCKRTNEEVNSLEDGFVHSVMIGTSISVVTLGKQETDERPFECELCTSCIVKVDGAIAEHLQSEFGLRIRR